MVEVGLCISSLVVGTAGGGCRQRGHFVLGKLRYSSTVGILCNGFIISLKYFLKVLTKPDCLLHQEPPRKEWL